MTDLSDRRADRTRLPIQMHMSEKDFERLTESSMEWGPSWQRHVDDGRFEHSDEAYDTDPKMTWGMAYWLGDNPSNLVLATSYLIAQGQDFEVLWDMAEHDNGQFLGYVLLTDFRTASWASHLADKKG